MLQNNPAGELELALRIRALVEGQNAIVGLGRSFLDINRSVEQLMLGLKSVSGSIEGANNEFAFLTSVAQKTGLAIETLGNNYLKLTASSKGTLLEGERVRTLFAQTSDALMKLGSDSTNTTRAMNALAQMMSKGQIYSEELKGQLAEAIPGALNIMSRALGLSVQEMLNLMEQGLLTSDALVLFGNQLKIEFGGGAETARTFNQVINDVMNQWTLLMKGLGDTGAWTGLKTVISGLGTSMDVLAAAAGAGLGAALAKGVAGLVNITKSATQSTFALFENVAAHKASAAAAYASTQASVRAAEGAMVEANAQVIAATAHANSLIGSTKHAAALKVLDAATVNATIKAQLYDVAQKKLLISQNALIKSTGLFAAATNLVFGPAGAIAVAIGTAVYFQQKFGDIGKASQAASQTLKEYSETVKTASKEELIASENSLIASKADIDQKIVKITLAKLLADQALVEAENNNKSTEGMAKYGAAVANAYAANESYNKIKDEQGIIEDKLTLTRTELTNRVALLTVAEDALYLKSNELSKQLEDQKVKTEDLRKGVENGTSSSYEYQQSLSKEIELGIQLKSSNQSLKTVRDQLISSEEAIQKQAIKNVDSYTNLAQGSKEYADAVANEANSIRNRIQESSKLTEELTKSKIETAKLRTETEAYASISKAATSAIEAESKILGDSISQRVLVIASKQSSIAATEAEIALVNKEKTEIEKEIALRERQIEIGTSKEKQVKEEIGALENLLIKKDAENEARQRIIETLKLEKMQAEASVKTMSVGMLEVETTIKNTENAINEQKKAYDNLINAGVSASSLIPIHQNILDLENKLSDASKLKAIVMKQGWESIGKSQEEAATGMDFQTRRMIDAFGELAGKGNLTSQQLTSSFTDVLAKANTTSELQAIGVQLLKVQESGKYSTDALKEMFVNLAKKLEETAKSANPLLEKMNQQIGASEKLVSAARSEAQASSDLAGVKGLEYTKREKLVQVAELEANLAVLSAQRKRIEAQAATDLLKSIQSEIEKKIALGEIIDEVDRNRLESATNAMNAAAIEMEAAGKVAAAEALKANALRISNANQKLSTDSTNTNTNVVQYNTIAYQENVKVIDNVGKLLQSAQSYYEKSRTEMEKLSEATRQYYDLQFALALSLAGVEGAHELAMERNRAWLTGLDEGSTTIAKYREEMELAWNSIEQGNKKMLFATNILAQWEAAVDIATGKAKAAFYEQATSAELYRQKLEELAESGTGDLFWIQAATKAVKNEFNMLDEEDLSGLQSALDDANDKIREMQEATLSAKERLNEMDVELLNAKGLTRQADLLEQINDYEEERAEIIAAREQAQEDGNDDLIDIYDQQLAKLSEINRLEIKNIKSTEELGNQNLSELNSALSTSKDLLSDIQVETKSAIDELKDLEVSLLEAKGFSADAKIYNAQSEYEEKRAAILEKYNTAKLTNDQKLISVYQQQLNTLQELYRVKIKNYQIEKNEAEQEKINKNKENEDAEKAIETEEDKNEKIAESTDLLDLSAGEAERLEAAISKLAKIDLSGLKTQFSDLHGLLSTLNDDL